MSEREVRHRGTSSQAFSCSSEDDPEFASLRPPGGEPVQVVEVAADHTFKLNVEALEEILLRDDVKNTQVVVLSVAGAFRKGKSFLLNFLIKYLNCRETGEEWMEDEMKSLRGFKWNTTNEDESLVGFSWRGGSERETSGILMWSKPFIVKHPSGETLAILLMDTQGAFDNQSTVKDCATIFAISTMLASVQVYNLSQMVQENDLQHLQLFTEYGRLAMQDNDSAPFQSLIFLVRDWSYPYDHSYGRDGGHEYLEKTLRITDTQHEQLQSVRKHINTCFETVSCFLMPHPGLKVATDRQFNGNLSDIDPDFKWQLKDFAPMVLSPENLVVKTINGTPVTGKGFLEYFKVYMNIFQGEELPEPKSMLEATAEGNNLTALAASKEHYKKEMLNLCGGDKPYIAQVELERWHKEYMEDAVDQFRSAKKMGGWDYSQRFEERLMKEIEEEYEEFISMNNSKNIFFAARTPAVLFALIVFFYLIGYFVSFVGVAILTSLTNYGLFASMVMLLVWSYIRYSGEYRELGSRIDNVVTFIWDVVIAPMSGNLIDQGIHHATKLALKKKL